MGKKERIEEKREKKRKSGEKNKREESVSDRNIYQ